MDLFDLYAKISLDLDGFERGLDTASKKFKTFSENIKGISESVDKAYSGLGGLLSPAVDGFKAVEDIGSKAAGTVTNGLKALAGAATVAAGGATAVGKSAFDAYANYEQLVGGIETLFKDSASTVMQYADNAYQTAGLSANQYMETATGFAASLLQSLGGDTRTAAQYANVAITDMSDNANKMGTDMQRIQDAYQGFAKQNYTMLDNLKLGYGGTKSEMQRLLRDAEQLEGYAKGAYSEENFADIVEAINIIQDHMDIMGTTAKEAGTTIQGSVASMKGAWENFMVGIADSNQDMGALMDNLIDSVVTAGNNVVPRIKEIVGQVVRVGPEVIRGFSEILPEFARMGGEIIGTLSAGLSAQVPALLEFGSKAVGAIADGITQNSHKVASGITNFVIAIVDMVGSQSDKLIQAGVVMKNSIAQGFENIIDAVTPYISDFIPLLVSSFLAYHETLFTVGLDILAAIGQGLTENKNEIQTVAEETITSMVYVLRENAPMIIEGGIALLEALAGAITENMPLILETGAEIVGQLVAGITTSMPTLVAAVGLILPKIHDIIDVVGSIGGAVSGVVELVSGGIGTIMSIGGKLMGGIQALFGLIMAHPVIAVITAIVAAVTLLWTHCEGFRDAVKTILEAIGGFFKTAYEVITGAFAGAVEFFSGVVDGIKGAFDGIGEFLGGLFTDAWEAVQSAWDAAVEFFSGIGEGIRSTFEETTKFLGDAFSSAWESVSGAWDKAKDFFSDIWNSITEQFGKAADFFGEKFSAAWDAVTSAWSGVSDFFGGVWEDIKAVWNGIKDKFNEIGGDMLEGLWNGIGDKIGWLKGKVQGVVDTIKGWFTGKSGFDEHSPSKWSRQVFRYVMDGGAAGLNDGLDPLMNEISSITEQVKNGMTFAPVKIGLNNSGLTGGAYSGQGGQPQQNSRGGDTFNFYSPKALDPVSAAREMRKAKQQMALGYV